MAHLHPYVIKDNGSGCSGCAEAGRQAADSSVRLLPAAGAASTAELSCHHVDKPKLRHAFVPLILQKPSGVGINQPDQPAQEAAHKLCFAHFVQFVHPDTPP